MPPPVPWHLNPAFWVYFVTWLPFLLFLLLYGLRSPWRQTSIGRGLFTLAASMVAVLTNALIALALGDYPFREVIRIVLVGGVGLAGWNLLRNLLGLQREAGRGTDEPSINLADRGPH